MTIAKALVMLLEIGFDAASLTSSDLEDVRGSEFYRQLVLTKPSLILAPLLLPPSHLSLLEPVNRTNLPHPETREEWLAVRQLVYGWKRRYWSGAPTANAKRWRCMDYRRSDWQKLWHKLNDLVPNASWDMVSGRNLMTICEPLEVLLTKICIYVNPVRNLVAKNTVPLPVVSWYKAITKLDYCDNPTAQTWSSLVRIVRKCIEVKQSPMVNFVMQTLMTCPAVRYTTNSDAFKRAVWKEVINYGCRVKQNWINAPWFGLFARHGPPETLCDHNLTRILHLAAGRKSSPPVLLTPIIRNFTGLYDKTGRWHHIRKNLPFVGKHSFHYACVRDAQVAYQTIDDALQLWNIPPELVQHILLILFFLMLHNPLIENVPLPWSRVCAADLK